MELKHAMIARNREEPDQRPCSRFGTPQGLSAAATASAPAPRTGSAPPATLACATSPLHHTAQNQVWLEIVQIALDLLAWLPMLALTGAARRWEPKRLLLRLFSAAARLVTTGRRRNLRLASHWPWSDVITTAFSKLQTLPNPG